MIAATRSPLPTSPLVLSLVVASVLVIATVATGGPKPETFWQVHDVHAGLKGQGRTVLKGTKVETFDAEVLGVLKNTSPGRDMVLCRLSGLNLDKTGVIAGMSGSPITIDGKLLGAVAYAWAGGKEPIAGVTPFCQMHAYVEAFERRDLAEEGKPRRVGLRTPVTAGGFSFDTVTVSQGFDDPDPTTADGLWMVPLRTPLAATGFTPHSLSLLRERLRGSGFLPMQGGGASAEIADDEKNTPLQAGGPLAVALVQGDFDMSGIGTVTHIEGNRVYGWGHPFMGTGRCEYPLMTGYIHTIYPRQTVSFKMGSPLRTVGVINADVSTGIAGWLERKPDLLPIHMTVQREQGLNQVFNVEVVRQPSLLGSIVFASLTNSIDMEGDLPDELTASLEAKIEIDGQPPVIVKDLFSGSSYAGGRAPAALYNPISNLVNMLNFNSYQPIRIRRIDCETKVMVGRRTADIESIELDSETYAPGDTLKAQVYVRPYKGGVQRLPVTLKLPADLPEGSYSAQVCDDLSNARYEIRDNPNLNTPRTLAQVLESLKVLTAARRTNLVVRVALPASGVALPGQSLPNLPPSMVQMIGNTRRTGTQPVAGSLVARHGTDWVLQGSESAKFVVTRHSKITTGRETEAPPADTKR
jgi:hypothetical protein